MFVACSKKLFEGKERKEIDNAFKAIDERINKTEVNNYEQTLEVKPINLQGNFIDYSTQVGTHQVNLLIELPAHAAQTITSKIPDLVKYGYRDENNSRNLYYINNNVNLYYNGNKVRAFQWDTIYNSGIIYYSSGGYTSGLIVNNNYSFILHSYTLATIPQKLLPPSNITVKLAKQSNNQTNFAYGMINIKGEITIYNSTDETTYLQASYILP